MRWTSCTSRRQFLKTTSAIAAAAIVGTPGRLWAAEQDLIVRSAEPYNAEPPASALVADQITPVKHFYVRNHGPTAFPDADHLRVRIEGMIHNPRELSLSEIKDRLQQQTTEA